MNFSVKESLVLKKLRSGQVATCFKVNIVDPRSTEIAAMSGFDCVWTCMEHVGNDWSTIGQQVLTTKAHGADLLCRVARGSYSDYVKPFELDASGIMVPHVMNAEDAESIVRMTRFPPLGRRAVDGGNADAAYCGVPFVDYLRDSNLQKFVALQIEDPESAECLEAIAAVKGYDILFFGPGDFGVAIGDPGNPENPRLREVRRKIPELAAKYGKFAGTVCNPHNYQSLVDEGYRFLSMGADVVGLSQYCQAMVREMKIFGSAGGGDGKGDGAGDDDKRGGQLRQEGGV